ncbi:MAG: BatA domain-containing protein, partial [bacterium]
MISFLNPFFLAFGVALFVPLVLHLIQSSRTVRLPFSTVRFLKLAEKRSSRRIKLENFILLLLRLLLMALLTLAFAMPMIRTKEFGNMLGR